MTIEVIRRRIAQGKSVDHEYVMDDRSGLIALWCHEGRIVLTWEEGPREAVFDESTFTRDERRDFGTIDEALEYLHGQRVDISEW